MQGALTANRRGITTLAVMLALMVSAFEGTVVTTAMPTIVRALGGEHLYAWPFTSFLVTATVGVLLFGRLSDLHGRRVVFAAGMATFLIGSLLCGLSWSMASLIAFRAVQGLGAGAVHPLAMTIVGDLYTVQQRARIQALLTSSWGLANLAGPLLGGALALHVGWRWVFLVNVLPGVVAAAVVVASHRDPALEQREGGTGDALLLGAAVTLAVLCIDVHTTSLPWVRGGLFVGALLVGLALARRQRASAEPLVPPGLLGDRVVQVGFSISLLGGGLLHGAMTYVPPWLEARTLGPSPLSSGALAALLVGWAVGSTFGVKVYVRRGLRGSVGGSLLLCTAGLLSATVMAWVDAPVPMLLVALFVAGAGLGPAVSTSMVGPQSRASYRDRGTVTSMVFALRQVGGALLVAALSLVGKASEGAFARLSVMTALALAGALIGRAAPGAEGEVPPP